MFYPWHSLVFLWFHGRIDPYKGGPKFDGSVGSIWVNELWLMDIYGRYDMI